MQTLGLVIRPPVDAGEETFVARSFDWVCAPQFDARHMLAVNPDLKLMTYMEPRRMQNNRFWEEYAKRMHVDVELGYLHRNGVRMQLANGWYVANVCDVNYREYVVWHANRALAGALWGGMPEPSSAAILLDEYWWLPEFDADGVMMSDEALANETFVTEYEHWAWRLVTVVQNRIGPALAVPNLGSTGLIGKMPPDFYFNVRAAMVQVAFEDDHIASARNVGFYRDLMAIENHITWFLGIRSTNNVSGAGIASALDAPNVVWTQFYDEDTEEPAWCWAWNPLL
jgi:hypothetical protein